MGGKHRIQPASRVGLAPLIAMAEQLLALLPGWQDSTPPDTPRRPATALARDLEHLSRHDLDGMLTASIGDDVIAFGVAFVRSRQLLVPHLWALPEFDDHPVVSSLFRRLLLYGERAAVQDVGASILGGPQRQCVAYRFGLRPRVPVYRLALPRDAAVRAGDLLTSALPGTEITAEATARRAWTGDPERLDRLVRNLVRPLDHEYLTVERGCRLATVRDGRRIAAYAYGGDGQAGPVVAATAEAALAGLGWALRLAPTDAREHVEALVPGSFEAGIEALLDAGAQCRSAGEWMSRGPAAGLERCVLASITLL